MNENDFKEKRDKFVNSVKNFFTSKNEDSEDDNQDQSRKKAIALLKEKKSMLIYLILGAIIWFGTWIRTRNLGLLKDITNGKLVPLALDPHLFLKYAKYIVEHGALLAHDPTRFVPLGTSTVNYVFMSSFIAYLHKFINIINPGITIEYVDVIYPAVVFVPAMLFFFLLIKRLFDWRVGLISTLFLVVVPAFLHRTMSGFSDHEALGIMLMFMAMYFYVVGLQNKSMNQTLSWGVLAGIFTGFMGLTWGGWKFLILIISLFTLVEFFLDKIQRKDMYQYFAWLISLVIITTTWIPMFSLKLLLGSFTTGIAFLVAFMLLVDLVLFRLNFLKIKQKVQGKIPLSVASFLVSLIVGIAGLMVVLGPGPLALQFEEISDNLLHPLGNDRWQLTVAEQHQPYFTSWIGQFGPIWFNIPLYLTLFMIGSVILFYNLVKNMKDQVKMTVVYLLFLLSFTMSRYSSASKYFNGTSFIAKVFYLGSLGLFVTLGIIFYFKSFYKEHETYKKILEWKKEFIFVLIWFLLMVVAARGAARLMFIFAPITAIMAGYAVVEFGKLIYKMKNWWYKIPAAIILILVLISPISFLGINNGIIPVFSKSVISQATYSGPSYNSQWQVTGQWVRENIPKNAVFGHWWDYGYWVQNGFERAAMLDGANKIKYWNYLMGRHVLTAQTQNEALEFLKVHDVSHYLIVSEEIGKYTAYSSIGSNEDFDRYSWILPFTLNEQGTRETRNSTMLMFQGSYAFDDDFVWEGKVFPRQGAGVGAVFLPMRQIEETIDNETVYNIEFEQPTLAVVQNGQRTDVPLECIYFNKRMFKFDEPGYKGCFRIIPTLNGNGQLQSPFGAGLFVSEEGVNALWVNLYLFEGNNPDYDTSAFELVYGEDSSYAPLSMIGGRVIGPQKIWKINYPAGFIVDEETKKKYLGGNELLPDFFFDVN
jgi:asparagine N-glycosylation enzyme membrane subunit Stt3